MKRMQRGLSLVELLVSLAIGSVLIVGAVYVYSQSRTTYRTNDVVARMQENARYAFSVIEPDLQLAGYYGFSNSPEDIKFITGGSTASPVESADMMGSAAAVAGLPGGLQDCGNNYAVDVLATVQGSNDEYTLDCDAEAGGAAADTDTVTLRRTALTPLGAATVGRLQLLASRLSPSQQYLVQDGLLPATPALETDLVQVRDFIVHTYYIANDSTDPAREGVPALRRKRLNGAGFADDEIMSGVEDLQVQFGIDTGDYNADGNIDPGLDKDSNGIPDAPRGLATRYVNADEIPEGFQVVSVRMWLLIRATETETGYTNTATYEYAGKERQYDDNLRRMLVTRTIQLRNARPF